MGKEHFDATFMEKISSQKYKKINRKNEENNNLKKKLFKLFFLIQRK